MFGTKSHTGPLNRLDISGRRFVPHLNIITPKRFFLTLFLTQLLCIVLKVKQVVLHEMLHNMGFWHEQNRADRDTYVDVIWENINPEFHGQFVKNQDLARDLPNCIVGRQAEYDNCDSGLLGNTYGLPYDYQSIMHYGPAL